MIYDIYIVDRVAIMLEDHQPRNKRGRGADPRYLDEVDEVEGATEVLLQLEAS